jgi:hypothetical protein
MADNLDGVISERTVESLSELEWRYVQYRHMLRTDTRLGALERQIGWRTVIAGIPWAILGTVIGVFVRLV